VVESRKELCFDLFGDGGGNVELLQCGIIESCSFGTSSTIGTSTATTITTNSNAVAAELGAIASIGNRAVCNDSDHISKQ